MRRRELEKQNYLRISDLATYLLITSHYARVTSLQYRIAPMIGTSSRWYCDVPSASCRLFFMISLNEFLISAGLPGFIVGTAWLMICIPSTFVIRIQSLNLHRRWGTDDSSSHWRILEVQILRVLVTPRVEPTEFYIDEWIFYTHPDEFSRSSKILELLFLFG